MSNNSRYEELYDGVRNSEWDTSEETGKATSKIDDSNPVDWRLHPRIQTDIRQLNDIKSNPNAPFGSAGPMAVTQGQQLSLKVTVTDPELAQVVLSRAFAGDENSRIPGMIIYEVGYGPDTSQNRALAQELRKLADDLEFGDQ